MQGYQIVLEQVLSIRDILRDCNMRPAAFQHDLVLDPKALAPRLVVDPALNRLLGSVEAVLLDLEPFGIGRVE